MSKGERCTGMRIFENNGGCELGKNIKVLLSVKSSDSLDIFIYLGHF
jgi:hypothetical protein